MPVGERANSSAPSSSWSWSCSCSSGWALAKALSALACARASFASAAASASYHLDKRIRHLLWISHIHFMCDDRCKFPRTSGVRSIKRASSPIESARRVQYRREERDSASIAELVAFQMARRGDLKTWKNTTSVKVCPYSSQKLKHLSHYTKV